MNKAFEVYAALLKPHFPLIFPFPFRGNSNIEGGFPQGSKNQQAMKLNEILSPSIRQVSRRDVTYDPFRCLFPSVPTSSATRSDDTLGG